MRKLISASIALVGAIFLAASTANATGLAAIVGSAKIAGVDGNLIKVHSRTQVHDQLHEYGYERVVYLSQYYGDSDKPNYRFRACQGHRAFVINVNWYGHIINQHPAGPCYDESRHRNDDGYRSRSHRRDR